MGIWLNEQPRQGRKLLPPAVQALTPPGWNDTMILLTNLLENHSLWEEMGRWMALQ